MAAQTNNLRTPTAWEIYQAQQQAKENEALKRQRELAKYQSILQWANQGNDSALIGNILGQLLKGGWNSMKKEYDASLAENADGSTLPNNPYTWYRKTFDPLVKNFFGGKKEETKQTEEAKKSWNDSLAQYYAEEMGMGSAPNEWKALNPKASNIDWEKPPQYATPLEELYRQSYYRG